MDTVLVGVMVITGVVIAISTGSKWLVIGALVLLAGLVARRLRAHDRKDRGRVGRGLG